jgi:hypothetical protein
MSTRSRSFKFDNVTKKIFIAGQVVSDGSTSTPTVSGNLSVNTQSNITNVGVLSSLTVTGNISAANYNYANGVSILSGLVANAGSLSGQIVTANVNLKGYVDGQFTSLINGSPSTLDTLNEIATALGNDANLSVTLTNKITGVQGNVTAANAAIVTANTNMKGYVDGQISTTTTAITTANTNMKGYVDNGLSSLSSDKISANSSNVTVTASFVNVAINSSNVATFSGAGLNVSGNVGIGNTNPLRTLSVDGSAGITGTIVLSGSNAAPNAAVTIRGYTGGTGGSAIANYQKSLVIGGDYNQSYNSSNAAILHIADYSNDGGDNVYPIYCEDENNGVDFYLYSGNNTVGTDKIAYFGGSLRINAGNQLTAIVNSGINGVGNIGASGQGFNTVFAKATSAQYADLAEVYTSDRNYVPGTVVVFGGTSEVTVSLTSHDPSVAGVVSTNPAYLMNDSVEGVAVALQGRVPCRVLGPVVKGDRVVTSDVRGVAERLDISKYQPGCIIGKTLGSVPDGEIATIEVVVGRN